MDLWNIIKTVGAGVISAAVPGGPLIVGAINAALPADQQLPANATGQQAQDAISTLPAAERAQIMDKQFDVEITQIQEAGATVRAMLAADAATAQTTRPYIAKNAFHVIAFTAVTTVGAWVYAVVSGNKEMVESIMNGWPFVVGVTGTLTALLLSYFGVLRQEHKQRMDAANGVANPTGLAGVMSAIIGGRK